MNIWQTFPRYSVLGLNSITILSLLCVFAFAGSGPTNEGISTSLVLGRTRFLSTEKAEATLTVVNDTTAPVFFGPCRVSFLVYAPSGWYEQSACRVVSNPPLCL